MAEAEPVKPPQQAWFEGHARGGGIYDARPGLVMTIAVLITTVSLAGLLRLRVDTNHITSSARATRSGRPRA